MNKILVLSSAALFLFLASCSKIEVDEERVNLVGIEQWCPDRNSSRSYTIQLTGEALYSFAESSDVRECLFFQLNARGVETEAYGSYLFIIRIENKNVPFVEGESPTMRTFRRTPAEIVLFNTSYGKLDCVFSQIDKIYNCTLTHVRDGIVAVSIKDRNTFFFKIDSFVTQGVRWGSEWPQGIARW